MEWILTNEEIPKVVKNVLVTVECQHRFVSLMWLGSDNETWHYADDGERIPKEFKVIAWQSLPEPYKK